MSDWVIIACLAVPICIGVTAAAAGLIYGLGWFVALTFYAAGTTSGLLGSVGVAAAAGRARRALLARRTAGWVEGVEVSR